MERVDRRQMLLASGAALVSSALACEARGAQAARVPPHASRPRVRRRVEIDLVAAPGSAQILPGAATSVLTYTGAVVDGPRHALTPIPGSHLGPVLRLRTGDELTLRLTNRIGASHVTHWHGLDVPADMDGHPHAAFPHDSAYTHAFPIQSRAGTYWYHPHTEALAAPQAYRGLAGFLIVSDDEEQALPLPRGARDVPLALQDASFTAGNQLAYAPTMPSGFLGDTILVNGRRDFVLPAATRAYRLRLLNASVSRIYKLAWSDDTPLVVIGGDGGLLAAPRTFPYVVLSPGERVELWADFRAHPLGAQVVLRSLAFSGAGPGQGGALDLMRVSIVRAEPEPLALPAALAAFTPYRLQDAINPASPRSFPISFAMMQGFTLNGGLFQGTYVAPNEIVRAGTLELVEVTNTSGMMQVAHPIHVHGRSFQILGRAVTAGGSAGWLTVKDGYVDEGWKDTFLVMPGETVRLLVQYTTYPGLSMYHCHNLFHEDDGMMRNLRVDP